MKHTVLLASLCERACTGEDGPSPQSKPVPSEMRCVSFGSLQPDGPEAGLIGRQAGGVADFKNYTPALKDSKIVWSEQAVDEFINDPGKMVPGTSMTAAGRMESADERRDIVAHIRRQDRSIDLCL